MLIEELPWRPDLNDGVLAGTGPDIQFSIDYPYKWVDTVDEYINIDECIDLWRAVILQAFHDATYGRYSITGDIMPIEEDWSPSIDMQDNCLSAQKWFYRAGRQYRAVCQMSCLQPEFVRNSVLLKFAELNKYLPERWVIGDNLLI